MLVGRSESLGFYRHNHIQRCKAAQKMHTKLAGVGMPVSGDLHSEVAERKPCLHFFRRYKSSASRTRMACL